MVVTWRELTSPLPVPPLMVPRAPEPNRAISPGSARGEGAVGAQQHHALGGESADGGEVVDLVGFHIAVSCCHADGSTTCRPPH